MSATEFSSSGPDTCAAADQRMSPRLGLAESLHAQPKGTEAQLAQDSGPPESACQSEAILPPGTHADNMPEGIAEAAQAAVLEGATDAEPTSKHEPCGAGAGCLQVDIHEQFSNQ